MRVRVCKVTESNFRGIWYSYDTPDAGAGDGFRARTELGRGSVNMTSYFDIFTFVIYLFTLTYQTLLDNQQPTV